MIELTEQQVRAVEGGETTVVDPKTQAVYILVRKEHYERLTDYDDSPWTDEEMDLLAEEAGELLDEYRP